MRRWDTHELHVVHWSHLRSSLQEKALEPERLAEAQQVASAYEIEEVKNTISEMRSTMLESRVVQAPQETSHGIICVDLGV